MASQWSSITDIAASVQSGKITATSLVNTALKTITDKQEYSAILATLDEPALARAKDIDARVASGEKIGRLAGVPFIAKDNFLVFGAETTAASNMLSGFVSPYQATAINRLEAEGAICVAKANLDAFAHGGSTENSDFMTTKNPHDPTRVPGGSSGGSAAAVVLDMAPFALGTDTGGSIRQPAAFSGAVGYKPTYGLVSRSGVVAMASSTDVVGPITRTVADAEIVLDVLAGKDELDSTTIEPDTDGYVTQPLDLTGVTIGVIEEYMGDGLAEDVQLAIEASIGKIKAAGGQVQTISLPTLPLALAVYYVLCPAEVSSNLSRYDGQRYGYTNKDANTLDESYKTSRGKGFGKEAKRRIMIGTYVLSSGYYDAYYKKAQTVRTKIINEFDQAFEQVDFLLGPVTPTTAFAIGQNTTDPLHMYLADIMTVAVNLGGIPAISLPCAPNNPLPVGLQLMAKQRDDKRLLAVSKTIEGILS